MKTISLKAFDKKIKYLVGKENIVLQSLEPYNELVCNFLNELSKKLRKNKLAQEYPDVISFAFWCRNKNMERNKNQFRDSFYRKGRGLLFHIAPSNVAVNFAFSYVFGLLSGNGNIVRVPSKTYVQVDIICKAIEQVLQDEKYRIIQQQTSIISYERDSEITDYLSSICDIRVIWGGDATIQDIRKSPLSARAFDVTFADRYSIGIVCAKNYLESSEEEQKKLAVGFYNDTYLMDQNACSTPHLIFWEGESEVIRSAKPIFWNAVFEEAKGYPLEDMKVSEKYTMLCKSMIQLEGIQNVDNYENILYVIHLKSLTDDITCLRGRYGLFYDYEIEDISKIVPYIKEKIQTLAYFGVNKKRFEGFVSENSLLGIDRIVPFGKSLDIGVYWDGYDLISKFSRIIMIE